MNVFVTVGAAIVVIDTMFIVLPLLNLVGEKRVSGHIHYIISTLLLPSPLSIFNIHSYLVAR